MKLQKLAGATSNIWQIFIQDMTSGVGAGLTGLTNASPSLTCYYNRDTDASPTVVNLVSMTAGTFTSSGFKEISSANMPGWYQFCPPDAALAAGAKSVAFHLQGATNMASVPIEVQLTAVNPDSATAFVTSVASVVAIASGGIARASFAAETGLQSTRSNTAAAGAGSTITLDAAASAVNSFYKGQTIAITGGTGVGQARICSAYVGSTKVATVTPAWATNPDDTSTFAVMPYGAADVEAWLGATAPANTGDAYARLGAPVGASISADIAGISSGGGLDAAGVRTAVGLATANLDTQLSGINAKTTNLPSDPADASDIAAAFATLTTHGDSAWATATGFSTLVSADVSAAVWDEPALSHVGAGTMGLAIGDIQSAVGTIESLVGTPAFGDLAADIAHAQISIDTSASDVAGVKSVTDSLVMTAGKLWVLNENGDPLPKVGDIATSVWTANLASYLGGGYTAEALYDVLNTTAATDGKADTIVTATTAIADQVWDAAITDHTGAGTMGLAVGDIQSAVGTIEGRVGTPAYGDLAGDIAHAQGAIDALPSAAAIADAVWEEAIADHSGTAGSTAAALADAGGGGGSDPWLTVLPGSYTTGQAGKLVGDYLDAAVSGAALQTTLVDVQGDVDAIETTIGAAGAGLTALATATALATLNTTVNGVNTRLGTPAGASVAADVAAVKAVLPAALVSGRMDSSVGAMATDSLSAEAVAAAAVTKIQNGLATPTNITAGTITTVTNLTNAPSNGDLTATMKASVTTAATAATPTAAAVTGLDASKIDATISSRLPTSSYVAPNNAGIVAIKASTDNLPSDPADQSLIIAATTALANAIAALNDLSQSDIRAAIGMASANLDTRLTNINTAIDDIPLVTAADNAAAVLGAVYEGTESVEDFLRNSRAVLMGVAVGMETSTPRFRDLADTKNRISVSGADAYGNRASITTDPS